MDNIPSPEKPLLVRTLHGYKPVNNDELKLEKGDIITVTQKEDGGWWEGTLNGRTGWFPANYVTEFDMCISGVSNTLDVSTIGSSTVTSPLKTPTPVQGSGVTNTGILGSSLIATKTKPQLTTSTGTLLVATEEQLQYRRMVLTDLVSSEANFTDEMQALWETHLQNLSKSGILTQLEFRILVGNFLEIIQSHRTLILNPIRAEIIKPAKEQRIGKLFLDNAPKLESIHRSYCENHPKAVQIIEKYKEMLGSFMESGNTGAACGQPGIIVLITGLSQPFSRLDKYPALIQELERHVEECHKDRGDLQRSVEYYKQIDKNCVAVRKQKEMELEVLSGAINGWEGSDISSLGDIIHMNLVHIGPDAQPRYFVLFANTLLMLAYNSEKNSLTYKGKVALCGMTVNSLLDNEAISNAFEIGGPTIEQTLVRCSSKHVKDIWLQHLNKNLKPSRLPSGHSRVQAQTFGHLTPVTQPWNISRLRPAPPHNPFLAECLSSSNNRGSSGGKPLGNGTAKISPGLIPSTTLVTHEEDFMLLGIVDAFCAKSRQISTAHSLHHNSIMETGRLQNHPGKPPRTLAEAVFLLREDVSSLKANLTKVISQLDEEQQARKALQNFVHTHIPNSSNVLASSVD